MANEGRFVAFVSPRDAERAVDVLRGHDATAGATAIGTVTGDRSAMVTITGLFGIEPHRRHAERGAAAADLLTLARVTPWPREAGRYAASRV